MVPHRGSNRSPASPRRNRVSHGVVKISVRNGRIQSMRRRRRSARCGPDETAPRMTSLELRNRRRLLDTDVCRPRSPPPGRPNRLRGPPRSSAATRHRTIYRRRSTTAAFRGCRPAERGRACISQHAQRPDYEPRGAEIRSLVPRHREAAFPAPTAIRGHLLSPYPPPEVENSDPRSVLENTWAFATPAYGRTRPPESRVATLSSVLFVTSSQGPRPRRRRREVVLPLCLKVTALRHPHGSPGPHGYASYRARSRRPARSVHPHGVGHGRHVPRGLLEKSKYSR